MNSWLDYRAHKIKGTWYIFSEVSTNEDRMSGS